IRLTRDAKRLVTLGQALARSGSRLEDVYWEDQLSALITKMLGSKKSRTLESVLDFLVNDDPGVYEIVVELAETCSESLSLRRRAADRDALRGSAPRRAWTRPRLPAGTPTPAQEQGLQGARAELIAAEGPKVCLLPARVTFDQMPQSFRETRQWAQRLGALA